MENTTTCEGSSDCQGQELANTDSAENSKPDIEKSTKKFMELFFDNGII